MILNDPSNYNFITTCFFAQMTAAYLDNNPLQEPVAECRNIEKDGSTSIFKFS